MSFTKSDRNIQSLDGKIFPHLSRFELSSQAYAELVSAALKREFAESSSAIKSIARITGASERSVKNWWTAKNGPSGEHLITLARNSNEVMKAFLSLIGLDEALISKDLSRIRELMVELIGELDSANSFNSCVVRVGVAVDESLEADVVVAPAYSVRLKVPPPDGFHVAGSPSVYQFVLP